MHSMYRHPSQELQQRTRDFSGADLSLLQNTSRQRIFCHDVYPCITGGGELHVSRREFAVEGFA